MAASIAVLGACHAGGGPSPPPPRGTPYHDYLAAPAAAGRPDGTGDHETMRLHVVDVGQGLAALVELPCGAILIDAGGELNERFDGVAALTRYLDAFFARRRDLRRRLDALVISHPHLDHTRGVAEVLRRYAVANVIDNGDVREEPGGIEQLAMHAWLAKHRRVGHADVAAADVRPDGMTSKVIDPVGTCEGAAIDPVVRALWGGPIGREEVGHDPNDDSVVVRVDFGAASLLLAGDLERLGIARLLERFAGRPELLDADVLVVPHHGSKHSTAAALIAKITPKVAVISAGPYERTLERPGEYTARAFGHPSRASILDLVGPGGVSLTRPEPVRVMLGLRGAWKETPSEFTAETIDRAIYSTGWDGDVVVTAWDNGWVEVKTAHAPPPVDEAPPPTASAARDPTPTAAATPAPATTGR